MRPFVFLALHFADSARPETYSTPDKDPRTGKSLDVGLTGLEPHGNPKKNDGFFENGILKAMESAHVANRDAHEVKVIGNGHCHGRSSITRCLFPSNKPFTVTENCRRVKGVWFCFGGGG